jgi:hypothetical protein
MDVPSYWYAALDPSTRQLAAELQELGGGDAVAANMELYCLIDSKVQSIHSGQQQQQQADAQMIWPFEDSVAIRDVNMAVNHRSQLKHFAVTKNFNLRAVIQDSHKFTPTRYFLSCPSDYYKKN